MSNGSPHPGEFAATRWTLVLSAARGETASRAGEAMAELCRIYWYPLYAFLRCRGHASHEAEDLTQEFFANVAGTRRVADVRPPAVAELNKDNFKVGLYDNDDAKPGLRAIGGYSCWRFPAYPALYQWAMDGKIVASGWNELIGRMEGIYSAEDKFIVSRFVGEGNRILADIQYVRASPEKSPDKRGYVWAELPEGLPPGQYTVNVNLDEYVREGGKLVPAPKDKIRHSERLTCTFTVPDKEAAKPTAPAAGGAVPKPPRH